MLKELQVLQEAHDTLNIEDGGSHIEKKSQAKDA